MTESNEPEIDKEKFKYEIEILRRINERGKSLRNWLMNTSLASLAFVITVFVQIRLVGPISNSGIATITFVLLTLAVLCACWLKFGFEIGSNAADVKDLQPLALELLSIVEKSQDGTKEQKEEMVSFLSDGIKKLESISESNSDFRPLSELSRLIPTVVFLLLGLSFLVYYLWLYLFK